MYADIFSSDRALLLLIAVSYDWPCSTLVLVDTGEATYALCTHLLQSMAVRPRLKPSPSSSKMLRVQEVTGRKQVCQELKSCWSSRQKRRTYHHDANVFYIAMSVGRLGRTTLSCLCRGESTRTKGVQRVYFNTISLECVELNLLSVMSD